MTQKTNIKSLLGLTQEETAMMLEITRMQWVQYSTNRREIPLLAKERLANVLFTLHKNKTVSKLTTKIIETEKKKAQNGLLQEYKTIEFKIMKLERELIKREQTRNEAYKALEVVAYLETHKEHQFLQNLSQSIKNRAINTLNKYSLKDFQDLKLKKESLEMLKIKIKEKLKN